VTQAELREVGMKISEGQLRRVETILVIIAAIVVAIAYLISKI